MQVYGGACRQRRRTSNAPPSKAAAGRATGRSLWWGGENSGRGRARSVGGRVGGRAGGRQHMRAGRQASAPPNRRVISRNIGSTTTVGQRQGRRGWAEWGMRLSAYPPAARKAGRLLLFLPPESCHTHPLCPRRGTRPTPPAPGSRRNAGQGWWGGSGSLREKGGLPQEGGCAAAATTAAAAAYPACSRTHLAQHHEAAEDEKLGGDGLSQCGCGVEVGTGLGRVGARAKEALRC